VTDLTCFKAYDVRGEIGVNIDEDVCYRIGRAVAQHFSAKSVVIGFDSRETSPAFAAAVADGVREAGADVLNIGMAGTEEMYWAVTEFGASAGIEVTASHNPINYNGMKIVKSGSRPLDDMADFQVIKALAGSQEWVSVGEVGKELDRSREARKAYVDCILNFVDVKALRPLKIVVNSGNGAAGPTFDAIADRLLGLGAPLDFVRVHNTPDATFPNGIPNPLLPENHPATAEVVKREEADFGVAFDGDFDRCFFFDETGRFVPSEYVVGLLASNFLEKHKGAKVVHDPRVIWNTKDIISQKGGVAIQSKTGHAFIKRMMRAEEAVYGGEMSAHHYFREFAYCDSGMIPWMLVLEIVSRAERSLGDLIDDRFSAFPSSGETNFRVADADQAIERVLRGFKEAATAIDRTDGVSLEFENWRFNLRRSNTEALIRLNIELRGAGNTEIQDILSVISKLINYTK
jgi:phosphomannomutase